jgi:ribosomal protein S18 acetylase RimI-like enzyme
MNANRAKFIKADSDRHFGIAKELFSEYARDLGFDLEFQDFEEEIADLPFHYGPPDGCILLAFYEGAPAGCVALRKLEEGICEMKRLYVKPEFRGKGLGKTLSTMILDEAACAGYELMRLDTLASMKEAMALYRNLGFYEIEAYRFNPFDNAVFLEKKLI